MATQLGHFGLAKECLRCGLACYGEDASDLYLLAWCEVASGATATAMELLTQARALDPAHQHALALEQELQEKLARWQESRWYAAQSMQSGALRLELLGQEHGADLLYQYRDRQIGRMTRLPEFDTPEAVQDWISEQQKSASRASFAVMHECWGFVGVVSCHVGRDAGYFYYWIGSDYQHQGIGQNAARMCFAHMAACGVKAIFTAVDHSNHHSQYLMKKLGFRQLPVRTSSPDDEQFFYCLGNQRATETDLAQLIALCKDIAFEIDLEPVEVKTPVSLLTTTT